jgi:hypothetical protein
VQGPGLVAHTDQERLPEPFDYVHTGR